MSAHSRGQARDASLFVERGYRASPRSRTAICWRLCHPLRTGNGAVDRGEVAAHALTERGEDRDAGDQNQRQHDGVLHRRGTVFAGQELAKVRDDLIHGIALA